MDETSDIDRKKLNVGTQLVVTRTHQHISSYRIVFSPHVHRTYATAYRIYRTPFTPPIPRHPRIFKLILDEKLLLVDIYIGCVKRSYHFDSPDSHDQRARTHARTHTRTRIVICTADLFGHSRDTIQQVVYPRDGRPSFRYTSLTHISTRPREQNTDNRLHHTIPPSYYSVSTCFLTCLPERRSSTFDRFRATVPFWGQIT